MDKVHSLREAMKREGLSALLVPRTDEFQGDHLPPSAERLKWLTGFTGSAGFAIITQDKAAFFTDGRYLIQAKKEIPSFYEIHNIFQKSPAEWVSENIRPEEKVGYDPWLFTESHLQKYSHPLTPLKTNLVDAVWEDRPLVSSPPMALYPLEYAGEDSKTKRARIGATLAADYLLLTAPASIAWLLNIRGSDVPCTPLVNSLCLLEAEGSYTLFVDSKKVTEEVTHYIREEGGQLVDVKMLIPFLKKLKGTCQLDPLATPMALTQALREAGVESVRKSDPCLLPKAIKNEVELAGSQQAHLQDGVALCRFLAWLEVQPLIGETTERTAAAQLYAFRQQGKDFRGPSFETISAFGDHGAMIHYHPAEDSDAPLKRNSLYLVDSGGQYLGGTTDVTRTLALGIPSAEEKEDYTRVLKGHIALARAVFPQGTSGGQLDVLARQFLWQDGLDYNHGTGHGVGSYLSVHEGPHCISSRGTAEPLRPGMILSNEPGIYKEGKYGIRIENLMYVREEPALPGFYGFETLTLVPLDTNLIDTSLVTDEEREWIKTYHARVFETLGPHVDPQTRRWLEKAIAWP